MIIGIAMLVYDIIHNESVLHARFFKTDSGIRKKYIKHRQTYSRGDTEQVFIYRAIFQAFSKRILYHLNIQSTYKMGNYSWLFKTLNSPEKCMIDWSKADTSILYKHWFMQDMHTEKRPSNLEEVAHLWNDTKLFGYLTDDYIDAITEFCKCLIPYGAFPRLYYEYEGYDMLVCFEFHPGTDIVRYSTLSFTKELDKENIPPHPEHCKPYDEKITQEEYEEWDNIYNSARRRVCERIIETGYWRFSDLKYSKIGSVNYADVVSGRELLKRIFGTSHI
jgi:hypothetical protein